MVAKKKSSKQVSKKKPAKKPQKPAPKQAKAKAKPAKQAKPIVVPTDPEALTEFLDDAIYKLDRPRIEAALAAGATIDPTDGSQSMLMIACYAENKHTPKSVARAKLLLELGADPTYRATQEKNRTALHELSFQPNLEILDALLAKAKLEASADDVGNTPMHYAATYCTDPTYFERLVALGNPVDSANGRGDRPIHSAIGNGNHKAIQWFVARGASLDGTVDYAKNPSNYVADKTLALLEKLGAK